MSKKNQEIAKEVLVSLVAKDKLDKIEAYLNEKEEIKREDLLSIIREVEEIDFE